ncbi:MAG: hypothetical protein FWG89_01060 [Treponema sp.]|nr:hypothetical protein [Treponema sp.]
MRSIGFYVSIAFFLAVTAGISAQEANNNPEDRAEGTANRPIFVFEEGLTASWLTRIIRQTERSNFVFRDFLPGLYFRTDLHNLPYVTPMVRLAVYYPLISTFNNFPQKPNTPLHYAADLTTGLHFRLFDFRFLRLNMGPALHVFFLNSDRWNYLNIGGAAFAGLEAPVSRNWTIIANGFVSLDNGNAGANRSMEPFDIVYQYQIDLGVRYSKKIQNNTERSSAE